MVEFWAAVVFCIAVVYSCWFYRVFGLIEFGALFVVLLSFCVLVYNEVCGTGHEKRKNEAAVLAGEEHWQSQRQEEDCVAKLEKLSELKNKGLLTEEEFNEKKVEILARM